MHQIGFFILTCLVATSALGFVVDGRKQTTSNELLSFTREAFKSAGILSQSPSGQVFLRLNNVPVQSILELSNAVDYRPNNHNAIGPHIPVIEALEANKLSDIDELGQSIHCEPLGYYTVVIHDKEYYMLAVHAPELTKLRTKYGLSPKLGNREFHLTIGVRTLEAEDQLAEARGLNSKP